MNFHEGSLKINFYKNFKSYSKKREEKNIYQEILLTLDKPYYPFQII